MKRLGLVCFLVLCVFRPVFGQSDGIFADFSTSKGNFTVWLDYSNAPRAVASFVGLATGEGGWADPQGNVWAKPFYDGSIFHRVVKDNNTNGVAIQGGGFPAYTFSTSDKPMGVSTSDYSGQLTTTNATGITTNILNLPVVTTNAAAVPTNYVLNGRTVETNAPMLTFTLITSVVVSSNSLAPAITNRGTLRAGFTNYSLVAQVATNVSSVAVVITNGSGTNVTTFHAISVQAVVSNVVRAPTVSTNFANSGYTMLESVTNGLVHSNGVISMANSGPNTDGSQFFITATNVPGWNGAYTAFGHVTTGMNVVTSIAAVAVQGSSERPIQDVVLSNVVIRRMGTAASNFNIAAQGVPVAESGPMSATTESSNVILRIEMTNQSEMLFRESADLQTWESSDLGYYTNATTIWTSSVPGAALGDTYFFHASRIRYPVPITPPVSVRTRTFTFWWNTVPAVKYEATFATNPWVQGTYRVTTTTVTNGPIFIGDSWTRDPYSARLFFMDDRGPVYRDYTYSLGFNPGQVTNRFICTVRDWVSMSSYIPSTISGVFTVQ